MTFIVVCPKPYAIIVEYKYFDFEPFGGKTRVSNLLDFLNFINLREIGGRFEVMFRKAVLDITEGLPYLHSNNVCHRDLKPGNILFNNKHYLADKLLLVYINGIQSELQHSKMTMFADDMAFYCHENSPTNLQSKLNADLAAITSWIHENKLTLNVTKSKFMIIGGRNKLSQFNDIVLVANNHQLENVTKFKYLE